MHGSTAPTISVSLRDHKRGRASNDQRCPCAAWLVRPPLLGRDPLRTARIDTALAVSVT